MSDHGEGSPFIAHHFDDAKHQFDSGKLGMWTFLAQEVLFFSALFVAYIIYRFNHPEIFEYAHYYLDTTMGAINTAVLICSSLSAAWAVRAAQLNQRKTLIFCLAFTILCAFGFLGIKYVEYAHKIHGGVLYGKHFNPSHLPGGGPMPGYVGEGHGAEGAEGEAEAAKGDAESNDAKNKKAKGDVKSDDSKDQESEGDDKSEDESAPPGDASNSQGESGPTDDKDDTAGNNLIAEVRIPPDEAPPNDSASQGGKIPSQDPRDIGEYEGELNEEGELAQGHADESAHAAHASGEGEHHMPTTRPPPNTGMFFTIYFAMTGLHGIHVIVGIGVFFWLLIRAIKGHFGEDYYGPIDFAALYWHLVDLIWIYLFPLLYLIH